MTLVEFLLARIAEDEAAAFGTGSDGYRITVVEGATGTAVGGTRLRAECEAKRRIIALCADSEECEQCGVLLPFHSDECGGYPGDRRRILELLALPYADRPDYDEEWRA